MARLLESLGTLSPPAVQQVEIVVVDNDPAGSARAVCERAQPSLPWPLRYTQEPQPGIPHARNACLRQSEGSDLVAFIDDDEVPCKDWLAKLVDALQEHEADVATGPVCYELPVSAPLWVRESGVFQRQRHPTGTERSVAFTNNVLFRRSILGDLTPWFDERMAFTGGSDAHFFRRVHRAGHRIVWVDDAQVHEAVPQERATLDWVMKRSFRVGSATTWSRKEQYGSLTTIPLTLLSCARWSAVGSIEAVWGGCIGGDTGKRTMVRGVRHVAYAAGIVLGSFRSYDAYSR